VEREEREEECGGEKGEAIHLRDGVDELRIIERSIPPIFRKFIA